MNKKILLGSILAVSILTLVSLSNVVGDINIEHKEKIYSPLFTVRTGIATNLKDYTLKNDYICKNSNFLFFNKKSNLMELIEEVIYKINKMDEEKIDIFLKNINSRLPKYNLIKKFDKLDLLNFLNNVKTNSDKLELFIKNLNNDNRLIANNYYTIGMPWYPGCFIEFIKYIILGISFAIFMIIMVIYWLVVPTAIPTCDYYNCPWS